MGQIDGLISYSAVQHLWNEYECFISEVRNGKLGKTAQFWLINYLDVMESIHLLYPAVQGNNYELCIEGWRRMMPFFLALNKTNYARYGAYYMVQLQNLDITRPGCKELVKRNSISVQGQDKYPLHTAIDQCGEQTLNKDAKSTGGIRSFASSSESVTKWTLNRASQASVTAKLKKFSNITNSDEIYKALHPHQIVKSEKWMASLQNTISQDFVNPFSTGLDPFKLYNLSSGIPVDDDKISSMLNIQKTGEEQYNDFVQNRLLSKFHDTLTRNKLVLFKDCGKNVVVKKDGKLKSIEVNRNIIGNLLALSAKTGQLIDFNKALEFPLCPVDLNLSNPDGSRRSMQKSKLTEIIIQELTLMDNAEFPQKFEVIAYVVDLMALVRTITNIAGTYEELTFQLIKLLPTGYKPVDIVADTYREVSIKDPERRKRGCADKVLIRSVKSKVSSNFNELLQNGENKTRLIDLTLTVILERKLEVLSSLNSEEIYFSTDGQCHKINRDDVINVPELSSNQEEADTKLCLHARHALNSADRGTVIVRNHSGDVNINVILIARPLIPQKG